MKRFSHGHSSEVKEITSQPPSTVVNFTLRELIEFLQQNQASSSVLQMVCPLFGSPLPSIDINIDVSSEKTARLELSLRASEALISHIRLSRDLFREPEASN
ncbi:hypothetical protein BO94DRAFT_583800 [Aspergillus sclerotioniger CBS 115572]|uniref:Uncharacterized protein n=1 Tax=Aspergillus sclerotioniger CBS 115572 TaxID=1450535 RepID=A0A317X120_9EURO|nr:hypothetical protein BO94DRAFT_583800 [Aspergillus sclerotioniger CBS 115572]PWY91881.1 hypothetical protein BO94DRAFT_583800 [Aspergillus sclerotioniger CBS 115572]